MTSVVAIYRDGVFTPSSPQELEDGTRVELIVIEEPAHPNGDLQAQKTPGEIMREISALSAGNDPFPDRSHDEVLYGNVYRPYGA